MRSCLLRFIAASVELLSLPYTPSSTPLTNGDSVTPKLDNGEVFTNLLENWCQLFESAKKINHQPTSNEFLVNLLPSRLHSMLHLSYEHVFLALGKFVKHLWSGSLDSKSFGLQLIESLALVKDVFKRLIEDPEQRTERTIGYYKNFQDSLVGCVEVDKFYSTYQILLKFYYSFRYFHYVPSSFPLAMISTISLKTRKRSNLVNNT